ncbi:protein pigeon-like [Physella acuta]|uniref:protein pigeon-like n=1 Tax=Physella acuta TaxID=109671 RepID=UPI0027DCF427|nr:protein pigeon-like [Physella acuta]
MFELHTSFDLLLSISQFIFKYRQSKGIADSLITPRIINQEKSGAILFVWNDTDPKDKNLLVVTNFGIYEPETQTHSFIYSYDKKVKVVSCSLNQERTLLAFSIVKPQQFPNEKKQKVVYQAFLAELQSVDNIVFSLNMERTTFLKVQFLYSLQPGHSHHRDSEMLVFLHKESIGLYRVPMARIGDRGIMMSGQPKTEQIVRKFVWCQWDVQHQRLHYIQNVRVENGSEAVQQKMTSVQFYDKGKYESMIEIPINFPFPYIRTADKPHYGDIPLHPGIPELALNVAVLTQQSGTCCLCYHMMNPEVNSRSSQLPESDSQDVEYYISLVHHAKTLKCCVYNLPKHLVLQKRLVFSWLGSYLVVMLPGLFVHLLNVGPSFEPCQHILLHNFALSKGLFAEAENSQEFSVKFTEDESLASRSSSITPPRGQRPETSHTSPGLLMSIPVFSEYCSAMKTLLPCQSFVRESGSIAQHLYDYRSGCILKLVLNIDSMLESFRNAYWQTRLAMLHYLILHHKDLSATKRLFEVLCENLANSEVNSMFAEFLVASTFAEMKKQVDREVLNLLGFTTVQTLRGQFEKNNLGERLAHISYTSLATVDVKKKSEIKNRSNEDFWDTLNRRLRSRLVENPMRFSHANVMRLYRQAEMEEAGGKILWDPMHVDDSFFQVKRSSELSPPVLRASLTLSESSDGSTASGRRSKTDAILGASPLFLHKSQSQESKLFKRRLSVLTEDQLRKHLVRFLAKESQSKAKNVSREYLYCQAKVSRQLCHLIWSACCNGDEACIEDSLLPNLQTPATDREYELFQLYERFYLSATDLGYPLPTGFSSYFTALGFKCLELHLFFQYVDNHILLLTPEFILQLLEDLPDSVDDEIVEIKYQVISRLPPPFAAECFERWNHPLIKVGRAREQVAHILLRAPTPTSESEFVSLSSHDANTVFTPLDTFIKHLDKAASSIRSPRPITYDKKLIQESSLHYTRTKTQLDLSTVSF